jgi:hypothetical protein
VAELQLAAGALRACAGARTSAGAAVSFAAAGLLAARAGRLDEAPVTLPEARRLFAGAGSAQGEAFSLGVQASVFTALGRLEEALAVLGEGLVVAERAALRRHAMTRLYAALARNRLAAGAVYAAEDAVRQGSELVAAHGECAVCQALILPELVRVALARERVDEAEGDAAALEALAERHGGLWLRARARAAQGRVLVARGHHRGAAQAFLAAAAAFDAVGALLEAARARSLAVEALRVQGDPESLERATALELPAAATPVSSGTAREE